MASVVTVEHGNGDVSIGVEIDGTYIPFSTVSKARIGHLQERAASLNERLESGDDKAAQDAVDLLPISAKATTKKGDEKGKG